MFNAITNCHEKINLVNDSDIPDPLFLHVPGE